MNKRTNPEEINWAARDKLASRVQHSSLGIAAIAALTSVAEESFVRMEEMHVNDDMVETYIATLGVVGVGLVIAKTAGDYRRNRTMPHIGKHKRLRDMPDVGINLVHQMD